jgi:hypothetical protein
MEAVRQGRIYEFPVTTGRVVYVYKVDGPISLCITVKGAMLLRIVVKLDGDITDGSTSCKVSYYKTKMM